MSEPEDPNVVVGEERETRLRRAVNNAIMDALEKFCDELYDAQRDHGFTDAEITKQVAELDPSGDFLEAWEEYVEDNS